MSFRSRWRPFRVRECRSGNFGRRNFRPRTGRLRRRSVKFWLKGRDLPTRRQAREYFLRAGLELCRRNLESRGLCICGERGKVFVPAIGKLPVLHAIKGVCQVWIFLLVVGEHRHPLIAERAPAFPHQFLKAFFDAVGDQKFGVFGPAIELLGRVELLPRRGFSMRFFCVLTMRRTVSDMAVDDDHRWAVRRVLKEANRLGKRVTVVCVRHVRDVPAVSLEAGLYVVAIREAGLAFNGDLVVVVDPAKVESFRWPAMEAASPEMPSIRQPSPQIA